MGYQLKHCPQLPASAIADEVNNALQERPNLVVTAPPGAGKSTLLPLTMLQGLGLTGKILMLEPRRLAARQVASRMAWMLDETPGQTVGYRIRFENIVSRDTRIEVLTEGILTRRLISDPALEGVDAVIFDEFHERSLICDEALALTLEAQSILRPDLKIIIMSATIDAAPICDTLNAKAISCEGRCYPIATVYSSSDTTARSCAEDTARQIARAHRSDEGDILAFLPGEADIRRCAELLDGELGNTKVFPLYGMLPDKEQKAAIAPSTAGSRKVVLATPIAETSLTIEGVRIVVDSGLYRKSVFDRQSGLSRLETVRVSMDMAAQRSGRAGRIAPGVCYRLWTEATQRTLQPGRMPEILEADLSQALLDVAAWGTDDITSLPWLTPPPAANVFTAKILLQNLGAIDSDGRLTQEGLELSGLPCHPRVAKMLTRFEGARQKALAADIAALLEEKDPCSREDGADIMLRIELLRQNRRNGTNSRQYAALARTAGQYLRLTGTTEDNSVPDRDAVGTLLSAAYPERIGKLDAAGCGHYLLSGGGAVRIGMDDPLSVSEWIVVASSSVRESEEGTVFMAAQLSPEALSMLASERMNISWDSRQGCITSRKERRIGKLLLDFKQMECKDRGLIDGLICEAVRKEGRTMLNFTEDVANLQRRVACVSEWHPESGLPDLTTEAVLAHADDWLPAFLGTSTSVSELKKIDINAALWSMLTFQQQQLVEKAAPSRIEVPTGSHIKLEYRQGADAPVLRVRLQECFGLVDTPTVDFGRKAVLMELLSPGYKPVQLTSDLRSFWSTTYYEVRKELRMRYPKHSWPEDPLEAAPVRGVKK